MDFLVKRHDFRHCRIGDSPAPELEPGQALLGVSAFGLTTNNITYVVFGEAMSYWNFFPAEEGWGRMPVWGFAEVTASEHDALEPGARIYGYLPPSTELVVTPDRVSERGFRDSAPHRADLPAVYNSYARVDTDPTHDPSRDEAEMLLRPLFITSFLIDDFLADEGFFGADAVVISSASSKTALAAAHLLSGREGLEVVGLTSPGNRDFVERAGGYDRVLPYDEVETLPQSPSVYVDIAGDGAVRGAVHRHYGDRLAHSAVVGASHWDRLAGYETEPLPGPRPTFFFAPDRVKVRTADWGTEGLDARVAEAWRGYVEATDRWLEVRHHRGLESIEPVYLELLEGRADPAVGHVISLAG